MNKIDLIIKIASSRTLLLKAIKIAFFVGIILNLINQGNAIISLEFEKLSIFKLLLTFLVPFCVSMYTAVSMKLKFHVGENAVDNATLRCKSCNSCINIKKNNIIPFCKNCKDNTKWLISSIKGK